jgi:NitT/TauT family transport system substrate-binding protein
MKKIIALILCCIFVFGTLIACRNENKGEDITIKVMMVDGAPLLSMVNMMSDEFEGINGYDISFNMTNDSDALVAALLNQEPDFAIAPINVAAMMNNNGSGYQLAAVTIWGIMHIVSDQDVTSPAFRCLDRKSVV